MSKKVLIITYYFPPSGGAGVQRCLKFVKYLPDFGWQPVVLTARDADYPAYDESLLAEIPPDIPIYRSKIFEPYHFYRRLTGKQQGESLDIATLSRDSVQAQKWSERLAESIRSWFFIPDARIGWKPFAVPVGLQAIREHNIPIILSSAPPYTCHLIGRALKQKTGLPWVADFRDSWVNWFSAAKRTGLPHKIELRLEHDVLKTADCILSVSPGIQADLQSRHSNLIDHRWRQLPNGFDGADFEDIPPLPPGTDNKLVITYSGSLYGNRNPNFLMQALQELVQEDAQWQATVQLVFVGRIGKPIQQRFAQPIFSGMIKQIEYLPHKECIKYLLAADVLLLLIDDVPANKGILTGKLFEYLGARRPILALAPEGDAANLIRELRAGFVTAPKSVVQIKQTLKQIRKLWLQHRLSDYIADADQTEALERRALTGQLAQILDHNLHL